MQRLMNRKREVKMMVVDIVVKEEVGVEVQVKVVVVVVEVIHSLETKITKIVIFQVLKL